MRNSCIYTDRPKTFRRSSAKILPEKNKKNVGWGGNLQNIEKSIRAIYIPDGLENNLVSKCKYWLETGDHSVFTEEELASLRVFLNVDQSGAEALIVAYDSTAGDYRQLFIHGVKPHVYVALKLFKDVWKDKMKESGGVTIDIDLIDRTPISQLKLNPNWKDLDNLIKASDNWSTAERYYYFAKQTVHCVDDKTEVLTPSGWVNVSQITNKNTIAIYDNGKIKFENPLLWNVHHYHGELIGFRGKQVDQLVTPNHKMIYVTNSKENVAEAEYVEKLGRVNIPTSGFYVGGSVTLPDWQIKLLVAIQADGYVESENRVRFRFAKERKIDRLHSILAEAKREYTFNPHVDETTGGNIVSDFGVLCPEVLQYFNEEKKWGSWLLQFSLSNLITLVNELKFWDGSYTSTHQHKREDYCSKHLQNVDWIKTICHLINRQGSVVSDGSVYEVGINTRTNSIASEKYRINYDGFVYCPTVSSGAFLIRRNDKISITKNSGNYDIQWSAFQMNVLEKSGGKILIPRPDSERFLEVYRGLFPEIPDRNLRVKRQVDSTGILYNMFGHPYVITNFNITEATYKEYYAWLPQSTVGEITRTAFCLLQEYIEDCRKSWDILVDCHDSYLVQCPILDVSDCKKQMQTFMNQRLVSPVDGTVFNMKSECQVGFNWGPFYPADPEKNPLGVREVRWL